jgi:hypothetical protein
MMLTDLAEVLRDADLTVVELPGWKARGHGPMTDVRGVTCHHTGSGRGTGATLGLGVVKDGRPGLLGPLAHLYLNREGTFYTVAAGLCWHAGISRSSSYTNGHRIGIEALAAGDGWSQDWPEVQMAAYARGCAALAEHYRFKVSEVRGHKETCAPVGRKIDPTFGMTEFRNRVGNVDLSNPIKKQEVPEMEWDDKITLTEPDARNMSQPGYNKRKTGDKLSVGYMIKWGGPGLYRLLGRVDALTAQNAGLATQIKALTAAVNAMAAGSPDAVRSAFSAGVTELKAELAAIDVRVTLSNSTDDDDKEA